MDPWVSATQLARGTVNGVACEFGAQQNKANLRAVAVGNEHAVAGLDDRHDVLSGLARCTVLIEDVHVLCIAYQRIAADGDNDQGFVGLSHGDHIVRAISALAVCRRFSASG